MMSKEQAEHLERATREVEDAFTRAVNDAIDDMAERHALTRKLMYMAAGAGMIAAGVAMMLGGRKTVHSWKIKKEAIDLIHKRVRDARPRE